MIDRWNAIGLPALALGTALALSGLAGTVSAQVDADADAREDPHPDPLPGGEGAADAETDADADAREDPHPDPLPEGAGASDAAASTETTPPRALPVEDVVAGVAIGLGVAATTAGLITTMLAQRFFERAEAAPPERRESIADEGRVLEGASIASWVAAGALLIGGLSALTLMRVERERAQHEEEAREERAELALEVGVSLGQLHVRGSF